MRNRFRVFIERDSKNYTCRSSFHLAAKGIDLTILDSAVGRRTFPFCALTSRLFQSNILYHVLYTIIRKKKIVKHIIRITHAHKPDKLKMCCQRLLSRTIASFQCIAYISIIALLIVLLDSLGYRRNTYRRAYFASTDSFAISFEYLASPPFRLTNCSKAGILSFRRKKSYVKVFAPLTLRPRNSVTDAEENYETCCYTRKIRNLTCNGTEYETSKSIMSDTVK